jgi:tRNA splicing ligase
VFNLEGQVEFGGCLRCVQVDGDGIHPVETPNQVFRMPEILTEKKETECSVEEMVDALRRNPYVQEKKFGNISSFNYSDKAFYDRVWDEQTIRARGLYIDTLHNQVAARAYDKFFNVNEREETRFEMQYQ